MPEYGILVDFARCIGCRACEVACQQENNTPDGINWIRNIRIGPEHNNGNLTLQMVSLNCMHCGKAPCIEVCPAKAIAKRPDGIVLIESTKCIGCKHCLWVCPFGAPQFNSIEGRMTKCVLCVQRVEKGKVPACVATCYPQALKFGTTEELSLYVRNKAARRAMEASYITGLR